MTLTPGYGFLSSVLTRIVDSTDDLDEHSISMELGYKSESMISMWLVGLATPPLARLVDLANAVRVPLEDLLLPWLADQDAEHAYRYLILAAEIMGTEAATDLLSQERKPSDQPWWATAAAPQSGVEVVTAMENTPPGAYRDW